MPPEIFAAALQAAFDAQVALLFRNLCDGIAAEAGAVAAPVGPDARRRFLNGLDIACLAYEEMLQRPA